jgi:hypothetical protein
VELPGESREPLWLALRLAQGAEGIIQTRDGLQIESLDKSAYPRSPFGPRPLIRGYCWLRERQLMLLAFWGNQQITR